MRLKKILSLLLAMTMLFSCVGIIAMAEEVNVAKVGNTEYATIDEAIANWTNGTTLTLLADVTLSDVIKLSSTEYHILDLGTYTMTAASGKDAIQYAVNGRSSASYALDIKADATNPGGITATGKTVVSHIKPSSNAPDKDRPITRFYGGVFNASYVVKQGGSGLFLPGAGYTGANAPYFQFYGGVYNGTIYTNRSQNQFHGGTFNGSMSMSVDSSAYTLVAGGTFKNLSNSMGSALNSDKFTIGSAKGTYNREVYVDDEGYYVVAAAEPAEGIEAAVAMTPGTNDYLKYSKVATEGNLNYTDVKVALNKNNNTSAKITVYVDELDMTGINYKGTIVVPEGKTLTITNAPEGLKYEGNVVISSPVAQIGTQGYESLQAAIDAATEDDTITLLADAELNFTDNREYNFINAKEIDLAGYTMAIKEGNLRFSTCTIKNGNIIVDAAGYYSGNGVFYMFNEKVLTLDNVKLSADAINGYSIFCMEGNSDLNLQNGTEVNVTDCSLYGIVAAVSDGEIIIDNSTIIGSNITGRGFLNGNYTIKGDSEITLTGVTKDGFFIGNGDTLNVQDSAKVNITLNPDKVGRYGINLNDGNGGATYNKAATATVNATNNIPVEVPVATVNGTPYTDFAEALAAAQAMTGDVTVEIYDKVTFNNHINGSYDSIKFVGMDADAEIYMDIQGYVEAAGKKVAFENLTLSKAEGGYVDNAGFMNLAFGIFAADEVYYANCTFTNGAYASYGKNTFTGCKFYRSHDRYGLWAYGAENVVVDGCTFADIRGIKVFDEGFAKKTALTVKNTDFTVATGKPAIVLTSGNSVTLENNTYPSTGVFELDLKGNPDGTPVISDKPKEITCINDNGVCGVLVDGKIYTTAAQAAEVATEGSKVTLLHNSAETVEFAEGVILDKNGFEAAGITVAGASLYGSGTAEDPYKIGTSEELFLFASKVNDGTFKSVYAELTANIDLEQEDWTSIGTSTNPFTGTFDGKGFTISNVWSYERGLFGFTSYGNYVDGPLSGRATIKNLNVENVTVINQSTSAVGGVVGQAGQNTELSNVTVTGEIKISGNAYVGGIVGQGYVHVDNCHVDGISVENSKINASYWAVGGIVGHAGAEGGASITNCTVRNISLHSASGGVSSIVGCGTIGPVENVGAENVSITGANWNNGLLAGYVSTVTGNSWAKNIDMNGTVPTDAVAVIGDVYYLRLEDAIAAATAGDTITLLADVTLDAETTLPAGITFNGNGKQINGEVWAAGDLTIEGHTKVANFNAGYNKPTITIGEGACLELTGSGRMVIGHGATFNITGTITDAKNANTADLTPSLIMPGASFTGAGVTFNVSNAYIKTTASYCSSSKSASGTFDFNIENSIWEQYGKLAFEAQSTAATVNFDLKDSVLTTTSHLVFGVSRGEIVIDNSNVNVGKSYQIENQSTMTIKNGSVVNGAVATSSNAKNPGTIIVEDATYAVTGQFSGSDLGTGTLIIKKGAKVSVGSIVDKANIVIDATGMTAETAINFTGNLSKFTGTVEVINNNALEAKIVDGKIVLVEKAIAQIGETTYTDIQAALKALKSGDTLTLLADMTITDKWDCRYTGGKITVPVTIDGNGHTMTFTDVVYDGGNHMSVFRFESDATVKNLTIDMKDAISGFNGRFRAISAKGNLTVDNCTFIGNGSANNTRAIIFGESGTAESLANVSISITNSEFNGWKQAIGDNETGNTEVKTVVITGNTMNDAGVNVSASESITFTGNTMNGKYVKLVTYADDNKLSVTATGNTLTENGTDYNYTNAKNANVQDEFVLPWDGVTISNLDELKAFRDAVNDGDTYAGKTVTLTADIDLAGENWIPIGTVDNDHGFMGNFDGQNHKIINLTITNPELDGDGYAYAGLFGITEGIDKDNQNFIKNLTIENVTINTTGHIVAAAIAYPYYTIVDNVKVCGKISISGGDYTAGVLAYTRRCIDASNLSVEGDTGSTISGRQVVGGVISDIQMNGGLTADYSNFNVSGVTISGTKNVGGISGIISEQELIGGSVKDVTLSCNDARVGIVSGSLGGASVISNVTIDNVTGASSIVGADYATGKVVEAKIGDKYYNTLADALKANVEDEITLLAPIVIKAGETLTLNKNVTITYTSNVPGEDMITNRGNLVIDGATLVYTNTDTTANNVTVSTISCEPGSTLEVKSGTVQNDSENNVAVGIYAYAIDLVTNGNLGDVKATISGGNVISTNYMAIRQFVNGEACKNALTVAGGTIKGGTRGINIQLKNNMAYTTISGGKIIGGDYSICFLTTSENVSVTGGEFEGDVWYSGTEGFISGGTFDAEPYAGYAAEGHVFEKNADGTWGVTEKEEAKFFEFAGANTTLGNTLSMNFYVDEANIDGDGYYAIVEHSLADGTKNTETIYQNEWLTDESGGFYYVSYTGIAAKQMADKVKIKIYKSDGTQASVEYTDSLKEYAMRGIGKLSSIENPTAKNLAELTTLVDMLNYGAEAQKFFGYNVENLANSEATSYQDYATKQESVILANNCVKSNEYAYGSTLTLENSILLSSFFFGVKEDMYAMVSFTEHYGNDEYNYRIDYSEFRPNNSAHEIIVDKLFIADADQEVTITVYNSDDSVHSQIKDSMNSFMRRAIDNSDDDEFYYSIAKFTKSAYNYLHIDN